jgi:hypothetical protein
MIDTSNLDSAAVSYVKLSFALSRYDPDYVDGYFGPEFIKSNALADTIKPAKIIEYSERLIEYLEGNSDGNIKRSKYLKHLIVSLKTRAEIISGKKIAYDRESELIYNVRIPVYSLEIYKKALSELDSLLPGKGTLNEKWNNFRKQFIIPQEKLDTVFKVAIAECRSRTLKHIKLPEKEDFKFELILSAPWGAYNWFKGQSQSLIQINSGLPVYIDRALDFACHEGYPGHHVYHTLHEEQLYKKSGLIEHSIIPLFSPSAVLSEGLATYAVELTFTESEKKNFEKNVLCRLAGISSDNLDKYYRMLELRKKLSYAGIETARRFLDGKMSREMAANWMVNFELRNPEEVENRFKFIEKYRSYLVTYFAGNELIQDYFGRKAPITTEDKWKLYYELLTKPILPEELK